jgi:hypothetical protein
LIRKPFAVTADKMHPINHDWEINAWVEPNDKDWKKLKILPKSANMQRKHRFEFDGSNIILHPNPKSVLSFGPKLHGLTAIAGQNGSGKTSLFLINRFTISRSETWQNEYGVNGLKLLLQAPIIPMAARVNWRCKKAALYK